MAAMNTYLPSIVPFEWMKRSSSPRISWRTGTSAATIAS